MLLLCRSYYGNINFFGGPCSTSVKASAKLKQLEDENVDAMFVFVSDVWLDQAEVLEKLHTMFSGRCNILSFYVVLNFKEVSPNWLDIAWCPSSLNMLFCQEVLVFLFKGVQYY